MNNPNLSLRTAADTSQLGATLCNTSGTRTRTPDLASEVAERDRQLCELKEQLAVARRETDALRKALRDATLELDAIVSGFAGSVEDEFLPDIRPCSSSRPSVSMTPREIHGARSKGSPGSSRPAVTAMNEARSIEPPADTTSAFPPSKPPNSGLQSSPPRSAPARASLPSEPSGIQPVLAALSQSPPAIKPAPPAGTVGQVRWSLTCEPELDLDLESEESERRRGLRHSHEVKLEFAAESQLFAGISLDISTGGIFIATPNMLPVGTGLEVSFQLPDGTLIQARGEVRWQQTKAIRDLRCGMGVAFTELSARDLTKLSEFCSQNAPLYMDF